MVVWKVRVGEGRVLLGVTQKSGEEKAYYYSK